MDEKKNEEGIYLCESCFRRHVGGFERARSVDSNDKCAKCDAPALLWVQWNEVTLANPI
jgi:hypothetical protein